MKHHGAGNPRSVDTQRLADFIDTIEPLIPPSAYRRELTALCSSPELKLALKELQHAERIAYRDYGADYEGEEYVTFLCILRAALSILDNRCARNIARNVIPLLQLNDLSDPHSRARAREAGNFLLSAVSWLDRMDDVVRMELQLSMVEVFTALDDTAETE